MNPRKIIQGLLLTGLFVSTASSFYQKPDSVYLLNRPDVGSVSAPSPRAGWQPIKSRFVYPKKAGQVRLACRIEAKAFTDSLGFIQYIQPFGPSSDSLFVRSIEKALISTAWTLVGKHPTSLDFQIAFIPTLHNQPVAIAITTPGTISKTWRTFTDSAGKTRSVWVRDSIIPDSAYLVMSVPTAPHPDDITSPYPIAGWDSLLSTLTLFKVRYYSTGNSLILVHINFDSAGSIVRFAVEPKDAMFRQFLDVIFRSFAWCAPSKNGKPVAAKISIPLFFHWQGDYSVHRLIVESR